MTEPTVKLTARLPASLVQALDELKVDGKYDTVTAALIEAVHLLLKRHQTPLITEKNDVEVTAHISRKEYADLQDLERRGDRPVSFHVEMALHGHLSEYIAGRTHALNAIDEERRKAKISREVTVSPGRERGDEGPSKEV